LSGFAAGPLLQRWGTGPLAMVSCVLTGGALLGYASAPSLYWLIAMAVPLGLGCGAVDSGLNHFVASHYSAKHMNWLHACWGVGAMLGPVIIGAAISGGSWRQGVLLIAVLQLALAAVLLLSLKMWSLVPEQASAASSAAPAESALPTATQPKVWALVLAPAGFFFYVAAESGVGLWLASVLVEQRGFSAAQAAFWVAVYFGAIMLGRFLVGLVAERWGNRRLVRFGVWLGLLASALFLLPGPAWLSLLALSALGLGLAPIYPSLMHEASRRFAPDLARRVIGWQAGTAYLGMAFCPPAMAALVLAWGLGVVFPAVLALLLLLWLSTEWLNRLT
jgi:fucose permease